MKRLKNILHRLICVFCKRDIDAIGQDNMSGTIERPMCNDCYNSGA